ncbi:hypothetical protein ACOSP7_028944 [Xanthoceras sorbifolium]
MGGHMFEISVYRLRHPRPTPPISDLSLARAAQHTHPPTPISLTVSLSPTHLSILWPPLTVASHRRLLSSSRRAAVSASRRPCLAATTVCSSPPSPLGCYLFRLDGDRE